MPAAERIHCDCGGELARPVPSRCPHCGRVIAGVRRRRRSALLPLVAVSLLFAMLVAYLV